MSWSTVQTYSFTRDNVNRFAHQSKGVYYLYKSGQCICIGQTGGPVQARLLDHFYGSDGPCTQGAEMFGTEFSSNPKAYEQLQLRAFREIHGRLPECNDRLG